MFHHIMKWPNNQLSRIKYNDFSLLCLWCFKSKFLKHDVHIVMDIKYGIVMDGNLKLLDMVKFIN